MVLVGLILVAYAPMVYFVVGSCKRVTMPMTDDVMQSVLFWIRGYSNVLTTASYTAIVYGLVYGNLGGIYNQLRE